MQPHPVQRDREGAEAVLRGLHSSQAHIVEDWLVWSQGDAPATRRHWLSLKVSRAIPDRDLYVQKLWKSIDRKGGANHPAKEVIEKSAPWEYYQRHFFGWFLSRFNLPAARKVFSDNPLVAGLHYLFFAVSLAAVGISFWWSPAPNLRTSLAVLGGVAILLILGGLVSGIPKYAYIHSLIPRLGAAVGIGYLFLASAPHLVGLVDRSSWTPAELILAALALLGVTLLYVPVHISRRVYPPPRWPKLFRLGFDVVALGVGYAALELLLFAPLLFSNSFLCQSPECTVSATPARQILCAAIALILGIVLQLAWDEKPLTEPL
jgi:hypothetical protein